MPLHKKTKRDKGTWSEQKKMEVLQAYIILGQLTKAAYSCGVPEVTAKYWKQSQWWKDTEYELRRTSKIQLSGKLNAVVDKALVQLQDRVENGDHIYNPRTKEFTRKPISAEHANKIVAQQIDRMQLIDKSVNVEKIDAEDIKTRLEKLKDDLIKGFSKPALAKRVIPEDVIEVSDNRRADSDSPVSHLLGSKLPVGPSPATLAKMVQEGPPRIEEETT